MPERMTPNQKAEAVVTLGLVRLTQFDEQKRVTGAEVAARNLDHAHVRYERRAGTIFVSVCRHASRDGEAFDHDCEGHTNGHVCYHARSGLLMAAQVAGGTVSFHDTKAEATAAGGVMVQVMVPEQDKRAVWASYRRVDKREGKK